MSVKDFFSGFTRQKSYDVWRLVDYRERPKISERTSRHIICDIDKTYLETEFDSLVKMAAILFEKPKDKITVEGASQVLLKARWDNAYKTDNSDYPFANPLHFVSSSPPQLRKTLEEKLALDGLDWNSDTFKNQAYNLKIMRFDLLKNQVAYKTAAILDIIQKAQDQEDPSFIFIGDNAENDAFIYLGIKLFLEQYLSVSEYTSYLALAQIPQEVSTHILADKDQLKGHIKTIFIRDLTHYNLPMEPPLTNAIVMFHHFFEVAMHLESMGYITGKSLWELARKFHNEQWLSLDEISHLLCSLRDDESEYHQKLRKRFKVSHHNPSPNPRESLAKDALILPLAKAWAHKLLQR